jgi:hypothetical protein
LGVGPVSDIEFDPSSQTVFIATSAEFGGLLAIDPDTGTELKVVSLDAGFVTALEAAEGSLFGVHQYIDNTDPNLPFDKYSLVSIDQDSLEFIAEISISRSVESLAYHAVDKVMFGVASGGTTGSELVKIDLTTGEIVVVGDPFVGVIAALDFNRDNILHVVERSGVLFNIPDLSLTEPAVKIGSIIDTSALTTTARGSNSAAVSGLTFVVGEAPPVDPITTICSSSLTGPMNASSAIADRKLFGFKLKRHHKRRAMGFFKFQATAGESVTIRLAAAEDISAEAEKKSTTNKLWKHWSKSKRKGRVFLGLRDAIPGVKVKKKKKGRLPLKLTVKDLPADGWYYIMVIQPFFRFHQIDYCLTVESGNAASQAWQTLEVAWPSDESEESTTSTP